MNIDVPSALVQSLQQNNNEEPLCAYLFDLFELESHVKQVTSLLPERCHMFYALKANDDPIIVETLLPFVEGFDVASKGEVLKVTRWLQDKELSREVLLGGPAKNHGELKEALKAGITGFQVESELILQRLNQVAKELGLCAKVLLRVNPTLDQLPEATLQMAGKPSQFGIGEEEINDLILLAKSLPHIDLVGFHFHCISNHLNASNHLSLIEQYLDKVLFWQKTFDLNVSMINVGGGIGINFSEINQFFDWAGFCSGLNNVLQAYPLKDVEIIFECGRFLVASCGAYASEVVDLKTTHGKHFAVLRGGSHHFRLPVSWQHNHPFRIVKGRSWQHEYDQPQVMQAPITVCGELCSPKDVLSRDVVVENIAVGDVLVFLLAGAYGWQISHQNFLSHDKPKFIYHRQGAI